MKNYIDINILSATLTATIFAAAGAIPIFIAMGESATLDNRAISSIILCGMGVSGVLSIYLSYKFKQPIYAAPSITAVAILIPMLSKFSFPELVLGYILAGILLTIMAVFKLISKIAKFLPLPIVLGMVAGVFMSYGLNLISAVKEIPLWGSFILLAYFGTALIFKKIPPQVAALISALIISSLVFPPKTSSSGLSGEFLMPLFILPNGALDIFLYVSLPLVIMALADIFKGYGVLSANGYTLSLDTVTFYCGVSSIVSAFGLGHTISLAGPAIAIVSGKEAGKKETRYLSSIYYSTLTIIIVLFIGIVISLITNLNPHIVNIICGLAMVGLLTSSLKTSFGSNKFEMGALTSFLIGLSHLSILGIGAPVWAIALGIFVSLTMEKNDFK